LGETRAAEAVLAQWYRLLIELIRNTATYSPPVAARSFAYLGITAFEALATGNASLRSLAGQVPELTPLPAREAAPHDEALVLDAALGAAMAVLFGNTGPMGLRAMEAMRSDMAETLEAGLAPDLVARSRAHGAAVAQHILDWAAGDGGAVIENMGFPKEYTLGDKPESWRPTSTIGVQQKPLLPHWGTNRPFAIPTDGAAQAMGTYQASKNLTDEHKAIARFWSDDPMMSPTPPGHWVSIMLDIFDRDGPPVERRAEVLALLGMAISDGFIQNWRSKYEHDLLRPVTYIRRVIDPDWEPMLITPPFPEYPSGHSTQSGAAAGVLEGLYGPGFAFDDHTHEEDGLGVRSFAGFWQAAEEAAISRLYGGIHYPMANENGLAQGACVAGHILKLKTRA
jgi:membrane-associated phospholipid phosphatase